MVNDPRLPSRPRAEDRTPVDRDALAIIGPTGVGKSALAMDLAAELGGEIINLDALQVYRGFDIGTAKPTLEERRHVPHHLIDILDPQELCSAGEMARRARAAIHEIRARGALPIVVGGSGLYYRALARGLSPMPPGSPEVRRRLQARLEGEGLTPLRRELERADPETARRLAPADKQRVLRALEVAEVSGQPLSSWLAAARRGEQPPSFRAFGLTLPRAILYDRIERRVARMFEVGWVREVESMLAEDCSIRSPAFQAIGYRQIADHLGTGLDLGKAKNEIVQATRRFAKRQWTWFRKEPGVLWSQQSDPELRVAQMLALIQDRGVGGS